MRNSRLRTRRTLAPIESWRDGSRHRQRVLQASGGIAPRTAVVHREYRASASVKRFPEVSPPVTHCAPSPEAFREPSPRSARNSLGTEAEKAIGPLTPKIGRAHV